MWPYPKIIAHRGAGLLAPENTLAALRHAVTHGYQGVEFDVMLASDDVPVLMHDEHFGRTVPGTGRVADTTAAQLAAMDAGSWYGPQFAGEPVPRFDAAAQFCRAAGLWMNVEIKPAAGVEAHTGAAVARQVRTLFADDLGRAGQSAGQGAAPPGVPLLSSFSQIALHAARQVAPELALGCLVDALPDDWQERCAAVGAIALHMNQAHVTPAIAAVIHDAGLFLFCYTANDALRAAQLLQWGVDGFCTDRPDLIRPEATPPDAGQVPKSAKGAARRYVR